MKRVPGEVAGAARTQMIDPLLSKTHPAFHAFLTDDVWEDGDARTPRELGSVIVWASDGEWRAKLLDRDRGASCLVAAKTWSRLLDTAEAVLGDATTVWRADKPAAKKGRR